MTDSPSPYDPGSKPPEASHDDALKWPSPFPSREDLAGLRTIERLSAELDFSQREAADLKVKLDRERTLSLPGGARIYALTIVDQANQIQELRAALQQAMSGKVDGVLRGIAEALADAARDLRALGGEETKAANAKKQETNP